MIINNLSVKKILIIKPRGIGDLILSTIVLKNLKADFPDSEIHYLTEEFASPVLFHNPFVSKIFVFGKSLRENLKLIYKLRRERYDLIFDFYSNPRTAQFTFFIKGKIKAGYDKRGRNYAYNVKIKLTDPDLHSALAHLEFLKALNITHSFKVIIYNLSDEEKTFAEKFFKENNLNETVIGIIPGGGWISKRCEPEKFVEICKAVYEKWNCKFLILYGDEDFSDAKEIYNSISEISHLAPKTTLREMVALISRCKTVIANDSGPMHLASAIGIPTIGIFGPTNPFAHRPFSPKGYWVRNENLDCIQCNLRDCPRNHECMKDLDVQLVIDKISQALNI